MIEILFNDSAAGSLKMAQHYGKGDYSACCVSVAIHHADHRKPTKAEMKAAQQEAEKRLRLAWENAVPLDGNVTDIFSFNLALSIGDITDASFSNNRQRVLEWLFGIYPEDVRNQATCELFKSASGGLKTIRQRAAAGEPIRIWYSNQPDEMCGLYWFASQLAQWEIKNSQVVAVKLPEWEDTGEMVVRKNSWGEVSPGEWHRYLKLQTPLPFSFIQHYAFHWRELQKENAPLRAVLNGRLISAPATLYDHFILREIAIEDEEFMEANVIGHVLSNYQLGIGDAWIALRIEEMIQAGQLKVVSHADDDMPLYHRMLKKCF